jgi:DNA repair protein SbcC/Rad50
MGSLNLIKKALMIEKITLHNFESHKDTTLEFSEGVNLIVGSTEKGKSSILRAIRWVINNKPSGEAFRSHNTPTEETSVTLQQNGTEIVRGRDNTNNYYKYDGNVYTAFGQDVPTPIKAILNLSDINTQFQFDTQFLLSESPGSVAKYLNSVINLDSIDESLKNANTLIKQVDNKISNTKGRIEIIDKEVNTYPNFKTIDTNILELDSYQKTIEANEYTISLLNQQITKIEDIQFQKDKIIIPKFNVKSLTDLVAKYQAINLKEQQLSRLITKINTNTQTSESITLPTYNTKVLESMAIKHKQYSHQILTLTKLINSIENISLETTLLNKEVKEWETKFTQNFPSICPLCLQPSPVSLQ